jgi:hypothetical protein
MKTIAVFLLFTSFYFAQSLSDKNANNIFEKFLNVCKGIEKLEYNVQRIDTFSTGETRVVNGIAFIIKNNKDKVLGYHFIGDNFDLNWKSFYDGIDNYKINTKEKSYKTFKYIKGTPGHQLVMRIAELIFFPDKRYDEVQIINETESTFTVKLLFNNEPVEDFKKIIVIDKNSFLPLKYEFGGVKYGNKYSHQFLLSEIKINDEVSTTLGNSKLELSIYEKDVSDEIKKE